MREIRFRGRDQQGEWVYGSLIRFSEEHNEIVSNDKWKHPGHQALQVGTDTVGQYTGLKDKNGVDIYEGDVLKHGNLHLTVCWNDGGAFFDLSQPDDTNMDTDWLLSEAVNSMPYVEVVGNIYENPELLR